MGHTDNQVRIRGHLVEPGEVVTALCGHADVGQACVIVDGEGKDSRLVAFLVPSGNAISLKVLRRYLRERVPDYMMPSEFVVIPALPTDARGERDTEALKSLLGVESHGTEYVRPRNAIEQYIVSLWEDLLPAKRISVLDDFFSLGGHSLLAAKVFSAIKRDLGLDLEFHTVLENSVLEKLAQVLAQKRKMNEQPALASGLKTPLH